MNATENKKVVKTIKVDVDKCIGCRACELACSAFHARPRYSTVNPARSRIRVIFDEPNDMYVPIRSGAYTNAECLGRNKYVLEKKEYGECVFCNFVCPWREHFKDPNSGLPLRCDLCESSPPVEEPLCVKVCRFGALEYVEREVVEPPQVGRPDPLQEGVASLIDRFGLNAVRTNLGRLAKRR